MSTTDFAKALQRMLAITDTGLAYTKDPFDRERYEDLRQILWSLLQDQTELNQEELTAIFLPPSLAGIAEKVSKINFMAVGLAL